MLVNSSGKQFLSIQARVDHEKADANGYKTSRNVPEQASADGLQRYWLQSLDDGNERRKTYAKVEAKAENRACGLPSFEDDAGSRRPCRLSIRLFEIRSFGSNCSWLTSHEKCKRKREKAVHSWHIDSYFSALFACSAYRPRSWMCS